MVLCLRVELAEAGRGVADPQTSICLPSPRQHEVGGDDLRWFRAAAAVRCERQARGDVEAGDDGHPEPRPSRLCDVSSRNAAVRLTEDAFNARQIGRIGPAAPVGPVQAKPNDVIVTETT